MATLHEELNGRSVVALSAKSPHPNQVQRSRFGTYFFVYACFICCYCWSYTHGPYHRT